MKINNITGAMNAYKNKGKVSPKKETSSIRGEKDAMNVSHEARTFSAVFQAAKSAPEIREEKVDSIKKALAKNEYKVDDEKLVDRLIDRMQKDRKY